MGKKNLVALLVLLSAITVLAACAPPATPSPTPGVEGTPFGTPAATEPGAVGTATPIGGAATETPMGGAATETPTPLGGEEEATPTPML